VPSGGAAAEEGQSAVNSLETDCVFNSLDVNRFVLLGGLTDADCLAIAPAYE